MKFVFAETVPKFVGLTNLAEGIADVDAITPMGAALHEPVLICVPFVSGRFVVEQKLMKLFEEVAEASSPDSELNLAGGKCQHDRAEGCTWVPRTRLCRHLRSPCLRATPGESTRIEHQCRFRWTLRCYWVLQQSS